MESEIFTPEALRLWQGNHLGIRTAGIYGFRHLEPFSIEKMELRRKFLAGQKAREIKIEPTDDKKTREDKKALQEEARKRLLTAEDLDELHTSDDSTPIGLPCSYCGKKINEVMVKSAVILDNGDLLRINGTTEIDYRGQFVLVGVPLKVHPFHVGQCIFAGRNSRGKTKEVDGMKILDLLDCQPLDQAKATYQRLVDKIRINSEQEKVRDSEFHRRLFGPKGFQEPNKGKGKGKGRNNRNK